MAGNSGELPQPQRCWPWSWWKRPWPRSSPLEVSIRQMSDREPGEGWRSTNTFGRLQSSVSSIAPESAPPVSSTHPLYQPVGSSLPPQEAISCWRRHPTREWPIGSNCSPAGQPSYTQLRAVIPVEEGVLPTENLPIGCCSRGHLILRPQMGPQRG